jgi:predicted RNA binding protein YcfA (HicA-like mRNA interferase family)
MSHRILLRVATTICIAVAALFTEVHFAKAQDAPQMDHAQFMHGGEAVVPTMPGQEVFGTIQEIVQILEADPHTDWSKVNIDALREHLIDMDEVVMRASADERVFDKGVEIIVTGEGRTREAIKRMVPAHAHELSAIGWPATTEELPNGVKLVVTATDPERLQELKALGFVGILTLGSHHQLHHLMMAKGEFTHAQ